MSTREESPSTIETNRETPRNVDSEKSKLSLPLTAVISFLVVVIVILSTVLIIQNVNGGVDPVIKAEQLIDPGKTTPSSRGMVTDKDLPDTNNDNMRSLCETPECIALAHRLNNWRDPNTDPCDDFYKASCGRYMEHTTSYDNPRSEKTKIVNQLLLAFLRKNETTTSASEKVMKQIYQKCEQMQEFGGFGEVLNKTITDIFRNIQKIGAWPISDPNWDSSQFDLNEMLVNIARMKINHNGLFSLERYKKLTIKGDSFKFFFPELIGNLTWQLLKRNGIPIDQQVFDTDVKDVLKFVEDVVESQNGTANTVEIKDYSLLKTSVPSIDFDRILKTLTNPEKHDWELIKKRMFAEDNDMFFGNSTNLETLLQATDPRIIANSLILNYISSVFMYINKRIMSQLDCDKFVIDKLPQAALRYFVQNYFDKENSGVVSEMVDEIKETYKDMFRNSTWLSEEGKEKAILKLEGMTNLAGYPADSDWEDRVEKCYEKIDINSSDTLFASISVIEAMQMENMFDELLSDSIFFPNLEILQTGAENAAFINHLVITAPFIDDPHFDVTFPKYAQLAFVGRVLAHEIGHGFDKYGIKFNKTGGFERIWDDKDENEYDTKTNCLVEQYNDYDHPIHGKILNGTTTLKEMIADYLGLDAVWQTFQRTKSSQDSTLAGFRNTDIDKMFFHIAALNHCEGTSLFTSSLSNVLQNPYPGHRFRVNGVFSNSEAFAKTFQCPLGTPMNPVKKCKLL